MQQPPVVLPLPAGVGRGPPPIQGRAYTKPSLAKRKCCPPLRGGGAAHPPYRGGQESTSETQYFGTSETYPDPGGRPGEGPDCPLDTVGFRANAWRWPRLARRPMDRREPLSARREARQGPAPLRGA